jgi:hypothetical protein
MLVVVGVFGWIFFACCDEGESVVVRETVASATG